MKKITNSQELTEAAYDCAYQLSNDWAKENPTWEDVEEAFRRGFCLCYGKKINLIRDEAGCLKLY